MNQAMTQTLVPLYAAIGAFLITHAIPALKPLRARLVALLGERVYLALYGLLSLAVLVWVGFAYAEAPKVPLWHAEGWMRIVTLALMPFASFLLVGALTTPNPLSIGIGGKGFDAARPGLLRVTRHPLTWAMALWAASHLAPNGDIPSLIMFGLFLALALAGPAILDAKRKASLGAERWAELARLTGQGRTVLGHSALGRIALAEIGWARIGLGLALYLAGVLVHADVIGVDPLAGTGILGR
jgi:uncharacterized membrane protein